MSERRSRGSGNVSSTHLAAANAAEIPRTTSAAARHTPTNEGPTRHGRDATSMDRDARGAVQRRQTSTLGGGRRQGPSNAGRF